MSYLNKFRGGRTLLRLAASAAKQRAVNSTVIVALVLGIIIGPVQQLVPAAQAADTGYLNPSADAADTGGDGDGFEVTPANAYTDGSGHAANNSGANDRHRFSNYGISVPAGSMTNGIEVRLDWWLNGTSGNNSMSVELSWNGGTNWTASKSTSTEPTSEATSLLGVASDNWGHSWTSSELSNANFRVRITSNGNSSRDFFLDWVAVKVNYTEITPNPALTQSCGLDIGLLADVSGSISSSEMTQLKDAFTTFASAFTGTPTVFSLAKFSTTATVMNSFSMTPAQAVTAISTLPSAGLGNTNWDDGLAKSYGTFDPRPAKPNLIVIATDGNPNRYGNPAQGTGSGTDPVALAAAVTRANTIKGAGTRILAIGIGTDLNVTNLKAITGTTVAPPAPTDASADVVTADFSTLGTAMSDLAKGLCGGKILVQKQFDTNGDGQADIDGSTADPLLSGYTFGVAGSPSDPTPQTTDNTGSLEFSNILNGTYSVTETTLPQNTAIENASCVNGNQSVGSFDLNTKTVSGLAIGTDDTIACTFLNTSTVGELTVVKQVVNGQGEGDPVLTPGNFSLHVKQGDNDVAGSPQPGSGSGTQYTLLAGPYTVTEDAVTNYDPSYSGACDQSGNVTLGVGQNLTCTITNTFNPPPPPEPGTLTVIKQVTNNNGGTASAASFTINVSGTNVSDNEFPGSESGTVITLDAGSYEVTEQSAPGYQTSYSQACAGSIAAGEQKTCTITNDDMAPSLTLVKEVVNNNGGEAGASEWLLSATGPTPISGQGGASSGSDFSAGTYSLSEAGGPADYSASDWVCQGGTPDGSSITLGLGESATCTITNDDIQPKLTVTKVVSGGSAVVSDFTLFVGQSEVTNGQPYGFDAGSYVVSETGGPGNYVPSYTGDCDTSGGVTLAVGDVKACTITNTYTPTSGTLKVIKSIVEGGEGDEPSDFTIHVQFFGEGWEDVYGSPQPGSGTGTDYSLTAGDYRVYENNPGSGWQVGYSGACAEDGDVTVVAGETVTCTVTNTKQAPPQLGSISGAKFNDLNGNGSRNEEPGLAQWTIYLDSNDNGVLDSGEPSTTTDTSGNYSFTDLASGTYNVREVQQGGWTQTMPEDPTKYTVGLEGNNVTGKDFGNHQNQVCETGCITVTDPAIVKTVNNGNPAPGATIVYTLVVSNTSDVAANPVVVTDPMPGNVTYVSDDAAVDADTTFASPVLTWNIASIPAHGSVTLHITATVNSDATGSIVNTATITGFPEQGNSNTSNDSSSASSTVQQPGCTSNCGGGGGGGSPVVDLVMTKTVPGTVAVGSSVTYVLTVSNSGPDIATNVIVTDVLPLGLTYVSSSATQGGYDTGTGKWSVGTLTVGSSATLNIVATLNSATVLNTSSAISSENDPNPANNVASYNIALSGGGGGGGGAGPTPQVLGAQTSSLPRTGGMPVEGMLYLSWLAPLVSRFRRRDIRQP